VQGYGIVIAFYTGSSKVILKSLAQWFVVGCLTASIGVHANDTNAVMVSVKPLAMIYMALRPQTTVDILLPAQQDMHEYSLSVTDIKRVKQASAFFWLGASSEPFLQALEKRFAKEQHWYALANTTTHAWLSQQHIPQLVQNMTQELIKLFPAEKQTIETRAQGFINAINTRFEYWQQRLQPYAQQPFLLGHDAFLVFSHDIGLQKAVLYRAGNDHGHVHAGMHELLSIQQRIKNGEIQCAFEEPDVSFAALSKRYSSLHLAQLEPLAASTTLNEKAYIAFIDTSAEAFEQCLQQGKR
jgi:zinc transport system substrate-binding protein